MEEGDKILAYWNFHYHYISTIIYKVRNQKIATKLWGTIDGNTWEFMYFFERPVQFEEPKNVSDTGNYLQSKYMGFAKIKTEKVEKILNDFGSLENLFQGYVASENNDSYAPIQKKSQMNILTAIKTKPFILLAGISGTGKSRLVRTLAYRTCPEGELRSDENKPGNFELIAVRPNWHDSTELLGYVSRINEPEYIITPFLRFLVKAWQYPNVPFFLCLDEMNLAPVEQYFAEYLSIIETRQVKNNQVQTDFILSKAGFQNDDLYDKFLKELGAEGNQSFKDGIGIPFNLVVMGTVNMDETTHSFSRKVLDRAMTIEMNQVNLDEGLDPEKEDWKYPLPKDVVSADRVIGNFTAGAQVAGKFNEKEAVLTYLKKLNEILEGTPFKIAYRVRDEFLIYCYYALSSEKNEALLNAAIDEMTCMKILSRIEGDENKTRDVLSNLEKIFSGKFPASHSKVKEMLARLDGSGYTSFWA